MPISEKPVILHKGIYKPIATVPEAIFAITGMTIGAGILGLPYAVAKVGLFPGILMILALGLIVLAVNLMLGEISVRTDSNLQLPGLAGKYLGPAAKAIMSVTIIFSGYGVLLAYLIGEGSSLAALGGGNPVIWTLIFWLVGGFFIWGGLQRVKYIQKVFSLAVIGIITVLSIFLLFHWEKVNVVNFNPSQLFFPLGVILFALHATPAVMEAHALLPGSQRHFRKALIIGTLVPVAVYVLFTLAVVGLTGLSTTEVATVGIGERFGKAVLVVANVFAILAMTTGFIGLGTALRETLEWDFKFPKLTAKLLVLSVPLIIFLLGARSFIKILDLVGGLFIGIEGVMIMLIYYQARRKGDARPLRYGTLSHPLIAVLPILLFFVIIALSSVYNFIR